MSELHRVVLCTATAPMGLIRNLCGSRFRQGEQEGAIGALKPDTDMVGIRMILEGQSYAVMSACWLLFKACPQFGTFDALFVYEIREGDVSVKLEAQDIVDATAWFFYWRTGKPLVIEETTE